MDLSTITVQDFKSYFTRDFPYLPVYSLTKAYKVDDIVYYTDEAFYKCLLANTGNIPPSFPTYWEIYDDDIENYILDSDIEKAFGQAQQRFNQGLFTSEANIIIGYYFIVAHFLTMDIRMAQQGVLSSSSFPVKKRKVGNVTEEYAMPAWVNDRVLSFYVKTEYGLKYLNMVMPKTTGHTALLAGTTTPDWNCYDN